MSPSSLRPAAPRALGFWAQLKAAARPIAIYWVFLLLMFGAFCVAAMIDDPSPGTVAALAIFGGTTLLAVVTGQIMALLRLRDTVIYLFAVIWWSVGFALSATLTAVAGELGAVLMALVILFPLFLTGGLWSLRVGRALFAAWVPLVYASGTAIILAESNGRVDAWKAGDKYAVWDLFSFGVLAVGIVLLLAFLVAREGHRLVLWQSSENAPLAGSVAESGVARPRLSLLGWLLLGGLAFSLAVGSALLAPYLWRTGPRDGRDGDRAASSGDDGADPAEAPSEPSESSPPKKAGKRGRGKTIDRSEGPVEAARQAAEPDEQGPGGVVIDPLLLLLLAILGLVLGGPPVRRLLLVERLRRPSGGVSATTRIEQGWRLVELALTDAGVPLSAGEPAEQIAARAGPVLAARFPLQVEGLAEAAAIRDRVAYGLGVDPQDLVQMELIAGLVYDVVWDRLGDGAQIRALYRFQ